MGEGKRGVGSKIDGEGCWVGSLLESGGEDEPLFYTWSAGKDSSATEVRWSPDPCAVA